MTKKRQFPNRELTGIIPRVRLKRSNVALKYLNHNRTHMSFLVVVIFCTYLSLCTDVPPPSGNIGRGNDVSSPDFSWGRGGGASVHRLYVPKTSSTTSIGFSVVSLIASRSQLKKQSTKRAANPSWNLNRLLRIIAGAEQTKTTFCQSLTYSLRVFNYFIQQMFWNVEERQIVSC